MQPVFSVSEFNEMINLHLGRLGEVVVEGEISQLKISQNKWVFATIKDEFASVDVFGILFQLPNLNSIEEGMLVKVIGTPRLYQKTGRFSLMASQIVPSGEGAIKLAYEKLKAILEQEGLFAPERKRPLPPFPETIGLITAKGSQAYQDFVKVSQARFGGLTIKFFPISVQGNQAVDSILTALNYFNAHPTVDVLVLTRGGGSLEDLLAFNDERVVRAVFASKLPLVCAVGHEGDVSLAELAADLRASTPSNAAELVVPDKKQILSEINSSINLIHTHILHKTNTTQHTIQSLIDTLYHRLIRQIHQRHDLVKTSLFQISYQLDASINTISQSVRDFKSLISLFPEKISSELQQVHFLSNKLITHTNNQLRFRYQQINNFQEKLNLMDYRRLLAKGYSLVHDTRGKLIKSVSTLHSNQIITTTFSDGIANSKITHLKKEPNAK